MSGELRGERDGLGERYAYGGIVFDAAGQVLMRSPSGHWGGYEWAFAKGGADESDESPEDASMREVQEETGYECTVVARIPGEFESESCVTLYFLMRPTENVAPHDYETQEIRWVSTNTASELIQRTKPEKGRQRDMHVLKSAIHLWNSLHDTRLHHNDT